MTRIPAPNDLLRRAVPVAGTYNFRDIGGYDTHDGGSTRWGQLFRSDALHNLDTDAQDSLAELGVRTVVDLRTDVERGSFPDALGECGPIVVACPILDTTLLDPIPTNLTDVYNHIIDRRGSAVTQAIKALAALDALPAVLHCTAGKDRTGVVIAILLSSLGVPDEVVAVDFAATELFLTEAFVSVLTAGTALAADSPMLDANATLIYDLLSRLDTEHGGALAFLEGHGLTRDEHASLREQLITRNQT